MGIQLLINVSKKLTAAAIQTSLNGAKQLLPSSITSFFSRSAKKEAEAQHRVGSETLIHRLTHLSTEKKQKIFQILAVLYVIAKVAGISVSPSELISNPMQLVRIATNALNISSEAVAFLFNLLPEETLKTMIAWLPNCNLGAVASFISSSALSIGQAALPAVFDVYVISILAFMTLGSPNEFFSKLIEESKKECEESNRQSQALEEIEQGALNPATTEDYFKARVKINPSALEKVPQVLQGNPDFLIALIDDPKNGEETKKNENKENLVAEIVKNQKVMQNAGITDKAKKDFLINLAKKYPLSISKIISVVPDAFKGDIDLLTQLIGISPKDQRLNIAKEVLKFLLIPRGTSADDLREHLKQLMNAVPLIIPSILQDNTCKGLMLFTTAGGVNRLHTDFIKGIATSASLIEEELKTTKVTIAKNLFTIILPHLNSTPAQETAYFLAELSKSYPQIAISIMENDTKLPRPVKEELDQSTDFLVVLAKYHVDIAMRLGAGKGLAYHEEFSVEILKQKASYFKELPEDLSKNLPFLSRALVYNQALMKEILESLDTKERRSTFLSLLGLVQTEYNQLSEEEKKRVPAPSTLFKSEFVEMMRFKKEQEKTAFLIDAAVIVPDVLKAAGKSPLKDVQIAKKIILRNPEAFVHLDAKLKTDVGFLNGLLSYELEDVQKQILEKIANNKESSLQIPYLEKDAWMIRGIAANPSLMEEWEASSSSIATRARERLVAVAKKPLFKEEYKSILEELPAEAWTTAVIREVIKAQPEGIHRLLTTRTSLLAYGGTQQNARNAHPNDPVGAENYVKERLKEIATHRYNDYVVDHGGAGALKENYIKREFARYNLFTRYVNLLIKETATTMQVAPFWPSIIQSNKEIRSNRVHIERLCKENIRVLQFASDEIRRDPVFLAKLAKKYGEGVYQYADLTQIRDPRNPARKAYDRLKRVVMG
ncbi:MAG: hypothetical protein RLZZ453_924 [Chlamydiota bacterium]|jgi:hypothetical protein